MKRYRVEPNTKIKLSDYPPDATESFDGDKEEGQAEFEILNDELEALQELLYAECKHKVLIVIQAMDTGGKDGTIRHVFDGVNPVGVRVASFKKPTTDELAHDYLWRVHRETPKNGEIVIFNRSHYEDVLVVRVHELVPKEIWSRRYDHINHFEKMLAEEGTTILKFFLHISKDEQRERLQARLDEADKNWKFNVGDLE
ncbi:MAG: PPK2 family polyphosphate kinase, partial [Phycisphaerae bacterium]